METLRISQSVITFHNYLVAKQCWNIWFRTEIFTKNFVENKQKEHFQYFLFKFFIQTYKQTDVNAVPSRTQHLLFTIVPVYFKSFLYKFIYFDKIDFFSVLSGQGFSVKAIQWFYDSRYEVSLTWDLNQRPSLINNCHSTSVIEPIYLQFRLDKTSVAVWFILT